MNGAVVEMLKKIADMSNVNLVKNTDDLLSKKMQTSVWSG